MNGTTLALAGILFMLGVISLQIGGVKDRTWLGGFALRLVFAGCCILALLVLLDSVGAQKTSL